MGGKYKIRRPILAMNEITVVDGLTVGEGATSLSRMYFGKTVLCSALATAIGSPFTASFLAASVLTTDTIFITAGSAPAGVTIGGASCIVDGVIKVYCYNDLGSTSAVAPLSFAWLAVA
jgi:hypothetical protein